MRTILFGILLLATACRRPSTQFSAMMTPVNQPDNYSLNLKAGDELVALGNEPSWSLSINPSKNVLRFKSANGDSLTTAVPNRQNDAKGLFRYTVTSNGSDTFRILFRPDTCMDKLSGQRYDYHVEVASRGKTYVGCGVSLRQLALLSANWVLASLQGTAVTAGGPPAELPRLEMSLTEGRVTGTTGCNRLHGSVKADTRQLLFGPLTTTKMACIGEAGERERKFMNELKTPFAYQVADSTLTLLRNGKPILVFRKVD